MKKITLDPRKMEKGWFGQSQRSYLWKIFDHKRQGL